MQARSSRDRGFTLIELLVTMTLFGILVTLGVMPLRGYQSNQEHVGAARDVVTALRNAQIRAVSEGTTYKVEFGPKKLRVLRKESSGYVDVRSYRLARSVHLSVVAPGFTPSARTGSTDPLRDAYFYPRGDASRGQLQLTRASSATKSYTITVEGLTARVSLS